MAIIAYNPWYFWDPWVEHVLGCYFKQKLVHALPVYLFSLIAFWNKAHRTKVG